MQNRQLLDDLSRVRSQLSSYIREKEAHTEQVAGLQQEAKSATGRISAIQAEQRQLRNRWLEEKTELENKVFQVLALQTQVQGSLRKKEKDYERLQNQLAKVVRDGSKANKAMVTISKPIKQNSSQKSAAERIEATAATLRGEETASLRQYVSQLEVS